MPPYRIKLPEWLDKAYTEPHIGLVLRQLAERESRRDRIRSTSQRQTRTPSPNSSPEPSSPNSLQHPIPQAHRDHYSIAIANHEHNLPRNRYYDVLPYDRTRVVIDGRNGVGRYLNANWVLERFGHKWWIAAQAPLPTTAHTFLTLILQPLSKPSGTVPSLPTSQEEAGYETSRIRTVVQLTRNVESGRTKAHAYFPSRVGTSLIIPPDPGSPAPALKITLLQMHNHKDAQCTRSTIAITPIDPTSNTGGSAAMRTSEDEEDSYGIEEHHDRRVVFQHLLYTAWPDHGVPEAEDRASLAAFLKLADQVNRDEPLCSYPSMLPSASAKQYDPDPPVIVGCSAGIGRTGSFIALSSLLRHCGFLPPAANPVLASVIPPSPLGPLPSDLVGDFVVEEIDSLREQRPRMVERPEQTLLVYELLINAFRAA
ncbi:phosphatases II [Macrolepiota fuliginosa MF-IS2]|uniref:Phosphatases II n=1 Tax=Macrolepiota fuliginosa MF-IS2 TaxID=1400762 RepID=A0A9P5X9E1_9AGAR|nr:phosphatases II [Macrolepiota fuliginosa MF-IS2]